MTKQNVYLAIPHTGAVAGQALPGLIWSSARGNLTVAPGQVSLLATNFNQLWASALNKRETEGITHFAMHHSDIEASPFWIDTLIDEMDRVGADVISTVIALKDARGLTTTAIGSGSNSIRRLTLREVHQLPETFSINDVPGDGENRRLLINTGLWVCRFTEDWIFPPTFDGFHLKDQLRKNADTGEFEAVCLSEDWDFSQWLHNHNLKVFATRKVAATHYGVTGYPNDKPAGAWINDLGDHRKDERPNITEGTMDETEK